MMRPAREGDFAELAQIHKACFAQAWDERALRELAASGASAIVAERNGIEGFILFRTAMDEAEILTIAVAPQFRRTGLGQTLVVEAGRVAGAAGAELIFLEVGTGNRAARALYAGLGFVAAGRRKGYYLTPGGAAEDALILRATLPLSRLGNGAGLD